MAIRSFEWLNSFWFKPFNQSLLLAKSFESADFRIPFCQNRFGSLVVKRLINWNTLHMLIAGCCNVRFGCCFAKGSFSKDYFGL